MTTTFLLIRHAAHDLLGRTIAGRMPGVSLNERGRAQAQELAQRLVPLPLAAAYSSPLERARETAAPIAARHGLPVTVLDAINELDFGEWTGQTLAALADHPRWQPFNAFRSGTRVPGGETMAEAQRRMVGAMEALCARHPDGSVALVGHGDPIKSAVAYFLGVPLDLFQRIEISPASVSVVTLADWGPRVLCVNNRGADLDSVG